MFAPSFAPKNNPEAIVNGKLALAFIKEGWDIDIITHNKKTDYEYTEEIDTIWSLLKDHTHKITPPIYSGLSRYLNLLVCFLKTGHPIQGVRWAYYAHKAATKLAKQKRYDIIMSRAMPENAHLPALLLSKETKIPWIANWNDPHEEMAPHPWEKPRKFSIIKNHYNKTLLKHINWHTFPSEKMRKYMSNYLSDCVFQKSSVMPHIGLDQKIAGIQDPKYFKICYSGALYKGRDPSALFSAVNSLISEVPDIKKNIRIILVGKFSNWITDLIQLFSLEEIVTIVEPMSYIKSLNFIAKMDLLFLLETDYTNGIFLPSKIADYSQVNRPIIAMGALNSEVQFILNQYGGGVYIPHSESKTLKNKLNQLYKLWENGLMDSIIAESKLSAIFNPSAIINKYNGLFEKLLILSTNQT